MFSIRISRIYYESLEFVRMQTVSSHPKDRRSLATRIAGLSALAVLFGYVGVMTANAATTSPVSPRSVTSQHRSGALVRSTKVTFHSLRLRNGWQPSAASAFGAPAYGLNGTGVVYLRGALKHGHASLVAVLPAGARPVHDLFFPIEVGNFSTGRLEIMPNGDVLIISHPALNSSLFSSLDGVSFAVSS
jgi:hypothetical protein